MSTLRKRLLPHHTETGVNNARCVATCIQIHIHIYSSTLENKYSKLVAQLYFPPPKKK